MLTEVTDKAYCKAIRTMFSGKPVAVGIKEYCEYLQDIMPHPIWHEVSALSFENDVEGLKNRLSSVLTREPPGSDIRAFYFGLSDFGDKMHLAGMTNCNVEDDGMATPGKVIEDWPRDYRSKSRILAQMYETVSKTTGETHWVGEACLPLAFAGLSISDVFSSLAIDTLLQERTHYQVAVCFNEGDFFLLGEIGRNGWNYLAEPAFLKGTGC